MKPAERSALGVAALVKNALFLKMKLIIVLAKIPLLSWLGMRNPFRAQVLLSDGTVWGSLRKEGRRSTLNLENPLVSGASRFIATEDAHGKYRILNDSGGTLLRTSHHYNTIEILEPALGEMDNFDFGSWSCPWGSIRISRFKTSIEVEVRDKERTAEFLLIGYLSYFTMSRIGH